MSKAKPKKNEDWFDHYIKLFYNYGKIYKNLEKCYEYANNPQKKQILREMTMTMLKWTLIVKNDMNRFYTFTPAINSDFMNIEPILQTINVLPHHCELSIP